MKDKKATRRTRRNIDLSQQPAPVSVTIPVIPQVPVTYSTTQPLPGISLDVRSVLRDLLEQDLPPDTIKKLR